MIDADTTESSKVHFEKHKQALVQVVEDNDCLTQGAAPTIADFLQHEPTNPCCRQVHKT